MDDTKLKQLMEKERTQALLEQQLLDELQLVEYRYKVAQDHLTDARNARADKMIEMRQNGFTANEIATVVKTSEQNVYAICRTRERETS